jgi:carbonic anhydrase
MSGSHFGLRSGGWLAAAWMVAAPVQAATFGYFGETGPEFWGELSPEWSACATGSIQSPVDLGAQRVYPELAIDYDESSSGAILDNGHTVEVELAGGSNRLRLDGKDYELRQFHFHVASEHRVEGRGYDMELHLVHAGEDGELAVVGVFLQRGDSSGALAPVFDKLPAVGAKPGVKAPLDIRFDPADFLPAAREHYRYLGSLTTPPCTEGVKWVVMREPLTVRDEDMARFAALIRFNARDTRRELPPQP